MVMSAPCDSLEPVFRPVSLKWMLDTLLDILDVVGVPGFLGEGGGGFYHHVVLDTPKSTIEMKKF